MAKLQARIGRIMVAITLVLIFLVYNREKISSAPKVLPARAVVPYDSGKFHLYDSVPLPASWTEADWTGGAGDSTDESAIAASSVRKYAFNAHKSSKLSLRRPLPDYRIPECKAVAYPTELPTASVIICFVNEMWSSLFRTVWSVLDRTPEGLLLEIILVDDASDAKWLGQDFQDYVKQLPSLVKLVRSPVRLGLIKARMTGARHAAGEVLIFLDSHCEATQGWIEPILSRIALQPSTVVCPSIDAINDNTLDFNGGGGSAVGGFYWTLDFNWQYPERLPTNPSDPLPSATMAGGLFAVNRKFWFTLGEYDDEMRGWGGENLELSFRIWMCGGRMDFLPCSHVGHIFRGSHPYEVPGGFNENFIRNSARLAEVWMDEYKEAYYFVRPAARKVDLGDISSRVKLRKELQCSSFKDFLDSMFPGKFVPLPSETTAFGQLKTKLPGQAHELCLDTLGKQNSGEVIGIYPCHSTDTPSQNQAFLFAKTGHLRIIWDKCIQVTGSALMLSQCGSDAYWRLDGENSEGSLVHIHSGNCLTAASASELTAVPCDGSAGQHWAFTNILNG